MMKEYKQPLEYAEDTRRMAQAITHTTQLKSLYAQHLLFNSEIEVFNALIL